MICVHIIFRSAQKFNHFFLGPFSSITPGFVEIHTVFIVLITNKPTNRQRWKLGNYMSVLFGGVREAGSEQTLSGWQWLCGEDWRKGQELYHKSYYTAESAGWLQCVITVYLLSACCLQTILRNESTLKTVQRVASCYLDVVSLEYICIFLTLLSLYQTRAFYGPRVKSGPLNIPGWRMVTHNQENKMKTSSNHACCASLILKVWLLFM